MTSTERTNAATGDQRAKSAAPKHTPGPWLLYDGSPCYRVMRGSGVGQETICTATRDHPSSERMANLRLIAAAPDMLAALVRALPHLDNSDSPGGCDGKHKDCGHCAAIAQARAAIAKATGRGSPVVTPPSNEEGVVP